MLRKDGLVRAREATHSMMQHIKDMRAINNMVEEVRARIMFINTELHTVMQDTEDYQQQAIDDATKKLQDSQEEKRELLQQIRTLQNTTLQLETERELFQQLIRKHEEEKGQLEEQLGYLRIQLDLDRAFLQHQTAVTDVSAPEAELEAKVETVSDTEQAILEILITKVFDGQLHQQILSTLWDTSDPIPIGVLKENVASEPLFNRALMELKARKVIELNENEEMVSMASFDDLEPNE